MRGVGRVPGRHRRPLAWVAVAPLALIVALAFGTTSARAAANPLFTFSPQPPPPESSSPLLPPPNGYLDGPCGLTVDSVGNFYIADHYHDRIDIYNGSADYVTSPVSGATGYITQLTIPDQASAPCALALDSAGNLYAGAYHGGVEKFSPSSYPPKTTTTYVAQTEIGSSPSTGVAVDSATDEVYVDERDRIAVYDSAGVHQRDIGVGTIGDGYGVAVSRSAATDGYVYVPDAADDTVEVYDATGVGQAPITGPPGGFSSLLDASVAVDDQSGDVYVVDNVEPTNRESPSGVVYVFDSTGSYVGHLRDAVVDGGPSGLAVDNSANRGRVYVTSGNTHRGGVYAYGANAAVQAPPQAPLIPPEPLGGTGLFPTVPIGSPAVPPGGVACEGDSCQVLPPEPVDPTLTTLLQGLGNPKAHYRRLLRNCRPLARVARKLNRRSRRAARRAQLAGNVGIATHLRRLARQIEKREHRAAREAERCKRANRNLGRISSASHFPSERAKGVSSGSFSLPGSAGSARVSATDRGGPVPRALLPGTAGFAAAAIADGDAPATVSGSHPYSLELNVGLDQGSGVADLRDLQLDLPPGLLVDPATTATLCSAADFTTPRSSPYDPNTTSGENCPERPQVGTVDVTSGVNGGETRRFGLFELDPAAGAAFRLGTAPYGQPLVFDAEVRSDAMGTYVSLLADDVPQALQLRDLKITLWGAPWDASHNVERGDCLNEANPSFAWSRCSVGEPIDNRPLAFLTLPTECAGSLAFTARVGTWQQPGTETATAVNRDAGGDPAPVDSCGSLEFESFDLRSEGQLSVRKASSSSGFVFHLTDDDPGLANPRQRIRALPRSAVVELPRGVTLNPSLGAGLETCTPAQLAAETAFNPAGAGCPNGAKIGAFRVRAPFYKGMLQGGVYLAQPDQPGGRSGAENPFDSLLAVYLIAKSADRGILITAPGKLDPNLGDGTLTATFDNLPQLPYTDLEVNFRSGQRAPLVSPPSCGAAITKVTLTPWAAGVPKDISATESPIDSGIDFGPCPDGSTPPFAPDAITGGVNSNVGSYTPYYVRLSRKDTEQEITSYSLVLPKGITGKLAGIPFCPDAAIAAARANRGFAETANPSCPSASQVGHTLTGYGVGPALTYATGRIYLAGPYHGAPLSLVTVNAATVGPFDLGTIVIRSAFSIDERTAQLQIDSRASDPIPHIRDGIVLHLRDIRIYMDRFQFTHNPSSCEPSQLVSTLTGSGATFESLADDSTATVARHFQLLNCLNLGFRPKLDLRLRGAVQRGGYPSLRASFVSRGAQDSNLRRIEVEMPHSLFLAQSHIRTICTREQFASGTCPAGSVYGHAVAHTLLFDEPLRGNVYLRSSTSRLPDLVADLRSGSIRIVVEGRIGPGKHGGIRAFFDDLPDAPLDRFTMVLHGGRGGLLQNSSNICRNPPLATVSALGQNNVGARFSSLLRGQCHKENSKAKSGAPAKRGGDQ